VRADEARSACYEKGLLCHRSPRAR
jgi:hypothetical protein